MANRQRIFTLMAAQVYLFCRIRRFCDSLNVLSDLFWKARPHSLANWHPFKFVASDYLHFWYKTHPKTIRCSSPLSSSSLGICGWLNWSTQVCNANLWPCGDDIGRNAWCSRRFSAGEFGNEFSLHIPVSYGPIYWYTLRGSCLDSVMTHTTVVTCRQHSDHFTRKAQGF